LCVQNQVSWLLATQDQQMTLARPDNVELTTLESPNSGSDAADPSAVGQHTHQPRRIHLQQATAAVEGMVDDCTALHAALAARTAECATSTQQLCKLDEHLRARWSQNQR
jgi:phage-related tail fiber protein